jgi:dimethylargininase
LLLVCSEHSACAAAAAAAAVRVRLLQHIQPPGTLDGGDVLQLPGSRHILVGLSGRTNAAALQQMQEMLPQHTLHGVLVAHGLHLKSACTALDSKTMVYADDEAGRGLKRLLQEHPAFSSDSSSGSSGNSSSFSGSSGRSQPWQHVLVEPACANLLLLGDRHVVMSGGFSRSEKLLEQMAAERGSQLHKLDFGEFAKADGSLTCCSILLP